MHVIPAASGEFMVILGYTYFRTPCSTPNWSQNKTQEKPIYSEMGLTNTVDTAAFLSGEKKCVRFWGLNSRPCACQVDTPSLSYTPSPRKKISLSFPASSSCTHPWLWPHHPLFTHKVTILK